MSSPYLRGFSQENLLRGLIASVVVAGVIMLFIEPLTMMLGSNFGPSESVPPLLLWLYMTLIWFVLFTLFHAALHAFFAWKFERGEKAFEQGQYERAARYLAWFARGTNDHYDDSGEAHRALLASLLHLKRFEEAEKLTRRCEKLGYETDLEAKD